jgi:L-ascorbate metabolism protein UlaG (beta-lactamase superfamily)
MKIKYYRYNSFIIESGKTKIAIDPGLNQWIFKLGSLIPKSEWPDVTHILATHGDPDHHWYTDKVAEASGAPLICGKGLVKVDGQKTFTYSVRGPGKHAPFTTQIEKAYPMEFGDKIEVDGVKFEAFKSVHGELRPDFFFGLVKVRITTDETDRFGVGATSFKFTLDGKTFVSIGDSLFQEEWKELEGMKPDVLMAPIGGSPATDEQEALELVKLLSPKLVIPCHYNGDFFIIKNGDPADDVMFKREVEKMGFECKIMDYGDEITI